MTFGPALLMMDDGREVRAAGAPPPCSALGRALLVEIAEALTTLARTGTAHVVDLRGLPLSTTDVEELDAFLGTGEVVATLSLAGSSHVRETSFTGVWRVRHHDGADALVADELHVATVPDVLVADRADIIHAAGRLAASLDVRVRAAEADATRGSHP